MQASVLEYIVKQSAGSGVTFESESGSFYCNVCQKTCKPVYALLWHLKGKYRKPHFFVTFIWRKKNFLSFCLKKTLNANIFRYILLTNVKWIQINILQKLQHWFGDFFYIWRHLFSVIVIIIIISVLC